jgi:RNA polymerase sigma-70 factor (ECF subfamily)
MAVFPPVWPSVQELAPLISAAQRGEAGAVDHLVSALRPALLAHFARRVPAAQTDDLTQMALMRIVKAVGRIAPERADRYVAIVARNIIRSERRRHARESRWWASSDAVATQPSPLSVELDIEYRDLCRAFHRAVAHTLTPELREVVLAVVAGHSTHEIAARQRVRPATVRTRLLRARRLLRRELGAYLARVE